VTVGHFLALPDTGLPARAPNLLIVGSDNTINIDGVRWFLEEVWPSILSSCPTAILNIVGRVAESVIPTPNVIASGPVLHLDAAYGSARLVVTPLRGGTGLKIKSAEALGAGRVVVSTTSAAAGLEAAIGRGLVVAASAASMAKEIVELLKDDPTVDRLSAEARRFAVEWNTEQGRTFEEVFARAL
jgi:glycosyltransferase involved in cell wall biosynthesis